MPEIRKALGQPEQPTSTTEGAQTVTHPPTDLRALEIAAAEAAQRVQDARAAAHSSKRAVLHAVDLPAETAVVLNGMLRATDRRPFPPRNAA